MRSRRSRQFRELFRNLPVAPPSRLLPAQLCRPDLQRPAPASPPGFGSLPSRPTPPATEPAASSETVPRGSSPSPDHPDLLPFKPTRTEPWREQLHQRHNLLWQAKPETSFVKIAKSSADPVAFGSSIISIQSRSKHLRWWATKLVWPECLSQSLGQLSWEL